MTKWKLCPECAKPLRKQARSGKSRLACPDGHFVHYNNPAPTAMGLIERDGKLLILKRAIDPNRGKWEFPGGFVESGEGPAEALSREVSEETRLTIKIIRILGAYPDEYGAGAKLVSTAYVCAVSPGAVKLSSENSEFDWREPKQIGRLAFPAENLALADYRNK
jgi:8-oxo-dGTP diphosphatase